MTDFDSADQFVEQGGQPGDSIQDKTVDDVIFGVCGVSIDFKITFTDGSVAYVSQSIDSTS
jgi:hypothetical protein